MISIKELTGLLGELANVTGLPDADARASLLTLELLLGRVSFDPKVDIEEPLANFLTQVKNPSAETFTVALRVAHLCGRKLAKSQRK